MPPKKPERKSLILEASFEDILVCNDKTLRPLLEAFVFEPENIDQKNLGTLFGIFEVADNSEDASYIVNYLLSVIKKEYFSKPKRPPIESFEAALHKGNLALSKIAEHGNVAWIGKLNAIIAILEKNNLHLTQAGNTSAFLFRAGMLTNISEGLSSPEADSNPLKTFVNVSSGRMEKSDKLLVATESIFDIFSLEEIKKSILRFSKENFVQFLKTALVNELQKAAVLIIDMEEKILPIATPVAKKKISTPNVFSQNAFQKELAQKNSSEEILEEIEKEKIKQQEEDKNKNASHIYIKESIEPEQKNELLKDTAIAIGEKLDNIQESSTRFFKKLANHANEKMRSITSGKTISRLEAPKKNFRLPNLSQHFSATKNKVAASLRAIETRKHFSALKEKSGQALTALGNLKSKTNLPKISIGKPFALSENSKIKTRALNVFSALIPNFSKIKSLVQKFSYQQRLYAILLLMAIVLIPFWLTKQTKPEEPAPQATQTTMEVAENPNQDKNLIRVENLTSIYSGQDILRLINLNEKIFAVSQTQITDTENKEAITIPQDFGKIKLATEMDDLGLIFIMNESSKMIAYSPVSKKFQDAILSLPAQSNIVAIGTYLTYLYAVDATNNQIYRFPRATGGFGEKTNWLKDSLDLSKTKQMSINDNIFLVADAAIMKLFRNTKQEFNMEDTYHKIIPALVYAKPDSEIIYILDVQNSKIAKLDTNGNILNQYFNSEIEKASDFSISEASNSAYLVIGNGVKTFNLNQ
jgi:hypothetical protein